MTPVGGGYRLGMATTTRHELDAADRNALSDNTFASPRLRKEPLNDALLGTRRA